MVAGSGVGGLLACYAGVSANVQENVVHYVLNKSGGRRGGG
jgi:hypothetical protein